VFITGVHTGERKFKSMSGTLNISSESEEIDRSARIDPVIKNSDRIKRKRTQTKIALAMMKRDDREGSTESCIASRFTDINDTDMGPKPISEIINRSRAGKTFLMRAMKSSGIIPTSTFPVTAQLPEFVM
ncbi:hypothetical protein KI387_005477, partial [Taxus chinensis]